MTNPPDEKLEIHFTGLITREIFMRAQKLHAGRRWILFIYPIVMLPLIFLTGESLGTPIRIILITLAVLFVPLTRFAQRLALLRVFKKSPYLTISFKGVINDERFYLESDLGHIDLPWSSFIKYKQTDDIILLYQGPTIFQVLAREFFADQEEWERARTLSITRAQSNRTR